MVLPRLLLFWLSNTVTELLHRASKPRMPPTQSPITHTCKPGTALKSHTAQRRLPPPAGCHTHLPVKGRSLQRPDEVTVHLIGSKDDGGHGVLVLRRRGGEQGQSGQRDVVLAAGQTALVVAVGTQTAEQRRGFYLLPHSSSSFT